MRKTRIFAAVFAAGTLAVSAAVGANADPIGAPTFRQLAGVGSDTTQDIMNNVANAVTIGGTKVLGSYDAVGSATISTKAAAACTGMARPNGSGAGRTALINSQVAGNGCVDFSRSSSLNLAAAAVQLTYVPFASDDLGFAVTATSAIPKQLTKQDLIDIYHCLVPGIKAIIPQPGSGTRAAWLTYVGNPTPLSSFPCITDTVGGVLVEEHDGRVLNDNSIVPYSAGKWLTQATDQITDVHGKSVLGQINGALASVPNPVFDGQRTVYNVIPTSKIADPTYASVFVGAGSQICSNTALINQSGFAPVANCGVTTFQTP